MRGVHLAAPAFRDAIQGSSPRGLGARSMEPLAVAGNGQYGYLDGLGEARRLVLGQLARLISSAADLQAASR